MLSIYLAGAIRDGRHDDSAWRDYIITHVRRGYPAHQVAVLNPLGGKKQDPGGKWLMSGALATSRAIVTHDFWCVERSDIIIFNFLALSEGYPMIGTLIEFGHSTAKNQLRYSIIDPKYKGHGNLKMYDHVHPFILENSALVFDSVEECADYLSGHLFHMLGEFSINPQVSGIAGAAGRSQ